MMVLGGNVVQASCTAPGRASRRRNLVHGDLAVTTDYRAVLADILVNRVGASIEQLGTVLPGYSGPTTIGLTKPRA